MKTILRKAASNVVRGWKSTFYGLILFAAILTSIFKVEAVTWTDVIIPLMLSLLMIFAPKDLRKALLSFISSRAGLVLWFVMGSTLLFACHTAKAPEQSQQSQQTKTSSTVQTVVSNTVQPDSAKQAIVVADMEPGKVYKAENGRATTTAIVDENGYLTTTANCKGEVIHDTITQVVEHTYETPMPCNHAEDARWADKKVEQDTAPVAWVWRNIVLPLGFVLLVLLAFIVAALFLKHLLANLFKRNT